MLDEEGIRQACLGLWRSSRMKSMNKTKAAVSGGYFLFQKQQKNKKKKECNLFNTKF